MSAKEWNLKFSQDLANDFCLFEVDEAILAELLVSGAQIKQSDLDKSKTACICSETRTYKLKLSETSNFLMVADLSSQEIVTTSSSFVEATPTMTKLS
jgi:hypothetical protein